MQYAELHCLSNFSFLEAASHPDELARRAAELGYAALAITDRNSLAGIVRAHTAAKDLSLKLIVGSEIRPVDAPPIVLWAKDRKAYGNLCRLITSGRLRAAKGQCNLGIEDLSSHSAGLLAGVVPPPRCEELSMADLRNIGKSLESHAICWPNCIKARMTVAGSIGSKICLARPICRWLRRATCCSTFQPARCSTTC